MGEHETTSIGECGKKKPGISTLLLSEGHACNQCRKLKSVNVSSLISVCFLVCLVAVALC